MGTEIWSVQRVLRWTSEHFASRGIDSPRLTAEVLLAHALGSTRLKLYLEFDRPLGAAELDRYRALVRDRASGVPTQHLVGGREFYGRWFGIDRRAFVPRPETELLVEACLGALGDGPARALDLCAGSGCVGLSLAAERPALRVDAVELSEEACEVARANASALGLQDRYTLLQGDLFAPLPEGTRWQVVASNPPYVPTGEIAGLAVEVREHDPRLALDGGGDGLDVVRRIASGAADRLEPDGLLALEIGDGQGPAVRALLEGAGLSDVAIQKDPAGHGRIATARRRG